LTRLPAAAYNPAVFIAGDSVALTIEGRPIRTVLLWLVWATVVSALIAGFLKGYHGAVSAVLGGAVNLVAGAAFGWVATRSSVRTAGETLRALIRAEASKLALIVLQLWLVLTHYQQIVPAAFFGTFVLTVVVFSMAILVRER
jgi:ATP synthase protein I